MNEASFLDIMMDTLQREDPLSLDMVLEDILEWDSLSAMAFIALADKKFSKKVTFSHLSVAKTMEDLYALLTSQ